MTQLGMNCALGTKWFTFYTKVRPWLVLVASLSALTDFSNYTDIYTENWWLLLSFVITVLQVVLSLMVFAKSKGNYADFVEFIKGVLVFETLGIAYQQAVNQYVNSNGDESIAIIFFIMTSAIAYPLWYCLNIRYFKKRVVGFSKKTSYQDINTRETQAETLKEVMDMAETVEENTDQNNAADEVVEFIAEAAIKQIKGNRQGQPQNESAADFGLVPEKPIFTLGIKSVSGEKEYLNNLYTEEGEKVAYNRCGSTRVEGISGMIDVYDTFLPNGQPYKTIYINMYGVRESAVAPAGFVLDTPEKEDQVNPY